MRWLPLVLVLASSCTRSTAPSASEDSDSGDEAVRQAAMRWVAPSDDARPVPEGPHVVVVVACTWRADQLPPWGGPAETSPTLARLASGGVVFDTTVAAAPWTRPASSAILTGMHPDAIGMAEPEPGPSHRALDVSVTTLAERLHEAGWSTVGVAANPNLNAVWGFDQGFDVYLETSPVMSGEGGVKVRGTRVVEELLARVADRPDKRRPVFIQAVLVDSHAPLDPDDEELARFRAPDVPPGLARYRAGLRRVDDALKALLDGLPGVGIDPDDTLVLVLADHGEGLSMPPSHGPGHGNFLYPSTVHVPFVVSGKGVGTGRIAGLAHQTDLVPTVLGMVGQPAVDGLDGLDLAALVRAGTGTVDREIAFTSTRFQASNRSAAYTVTHQCQLDEAPKATARAVSSRNARPFDTSCCAWVEDPSCGSPVWDEDLMNHLKKWSIQQGRAASSGSRRIVSPDSDLEAQLRALGYRQ